MKCFFILPLKEQKIHTKCLTKVKAKYLTYITTKIISLVKINYYKLQIQRGSSTTLPTTQLKLKSSEKSGLLLILYKDPPNNQ